MVKPRAIDDVPIVALTLWSATLDDFALRRVAAMIENEVKQIHDVGDVTLIGGRPRELAVALDPRRLASYGLAPAAVVQALEGANVSLATGAYREGDRVVGVTTNRGEIRAKKVAVAVAGNTGRVMKLAGIDKLPIETHVLQAFVSESLEPTLPGVITWGGGHLYVSQSDKCGLVFGGDLDGYNSYAQRGNLRVVEEVMS